MTKKKVTMLALLAVVIGGGYLGYEKIYKPLYSSETKERTFEISEKLNVKSFSEVEVEFTHQWNKDTSFPYSGSTVIDRNGNGEKEIFVGGGDGQDDAFITFKDNKLTTEALPKGEDSSATYGALSFDVDNDGDSDLILTRANGVYFYLNNSGDFSEIKKIYTPASEVTPLNVAISDINSDGMIDLYISNFVAPSSFKVSTFNDPNHAKANTMLLNKGNFEFEDVTEKTGTAGSQNTFHSTFADLDGDFRPDLIVANNTGMVEIFKNTGDLSFEKVEVPSGLGYWMGIGIGDIDNDGDNDLYFPNVGNTVAASALRGDLKDDQDLNIEHLLLINEGDFKLTDATTEKGFNRLGFSWGGTVTDINLDGEKDVLIAQNYVKLNLPGKDLLDGKVMLQENGKFEHADKLGLNDQHYGQAAMLVDFNNDSKPDVFWVNMNDIQKAYLNESSNNAFKVSTPDNIKFLNAKVTIETMNGKSLTQEIIANTGMSTDGDNTLFFGLGADDSVKNITVKTMNGESKDYPIGEGLNSFIIQN